MLRPDLAKGGKFIVAEGTAIKEQAIVEAVGPLVKHTQKGERVLFNAWACDEKIVDGTRYYFTPESANAICATI